MRYILETNTPELIQDFVNGRSDVEIVESYEPVERLTARVEKIHQTFMEFKAQRGSWNILRTYLKGKNITNVEIDKVLSGVEDFLKEV